MSYSIAQRTHEIGIHMALGAQFGNVMRMVLSQGFRITVVGVAIGLAGALLLTRLMSGLLYSIQAADPLTFASVGLILFLVALLACYIPARRAAGVDPVVALRCE
jgi:putative ABC transport system permease protein